MSSTNNRRTRNNRRTINASQATNNSEVSSTSHASHTSNTSHTSNASHASHTSNTIQVTHSDMKHWKNMWSDILGDPDFRYQITNNKNSSGYFDLFKNGKVTDVRSETMKEQGVSSDKGTFYMKFGLLAHFVAYKINYEKGNKKGNKKAIKGITIFDSSHSIGDELGLYRDCLPDFMRTIAIHFSLTIEFDEQFGTPQTLPGDSFCQTWSLAYLIGKPTHKIMKKLTDENNPNPDKIEILYEICKYIIELPVFEFICNNNAAWINENFHNNNAPRTKWNAEYFLHFSRNILDIHSFHYLFV